MHLACAYDAHAHIFDAHLDSLKDHNYFGLDFMKVKDRVYP